MRGNALTARLVHSKTIGADRTLSHRLVVIAERCHVRKPDWLSCGWRFLSTKADFPRTSCCPISSGNLKGCLHRESATTRAYALQSRVMDVPSAQAKRNSHFWTPHPGRNSLTSAAAGLNVEKSDRDMLGGWMAQESDRYNRRKGQDSGGPKPGRCDLRRPCQQRSPFRSRCTGGALSFSGGRAQAQNSRRKSQEDVE